MPIFYHPPPISPQPNLYHKRIPPQFIITEPVYSLVSRGRYFDGVKLELSTIYFNGVADTLGEVSCQWQVSAGDSDAAYSDIYGATTKEFFYGDAPAYPIGRYYRCRLNAVGAEQVISISARGYVRNPVMPDILPEGILVLKDMAGVTLAPVPNAFGAGTDYAVNLLGRLKLSVPADVAMVDNLVELNTVWEYDQDGKLKNWFWIARKTSDS